MSSTSINLRLFSKASAMLRGYMKPRFLTTEDLRQIALRAKVDVTKDKNARPLSNELFYDWMGSLRESHTIAEIKKGVYANLTALPRPTAQEIAQYIEPDAVVSLHSVLGESGVLNNPSTVITCIVPISPEDWRKHKVKRHEVNVPGVSRFQFFTMSEALARPQSVNSVTIHESDYLNESKENYAQATSEKALLDWIHLANNKQGKMKGLFPPLDMDLSLLSIVKLKKLSKAMGLQQLLNEYLEQKQDYDNNPNTKYNMDTNLGL